MRAVGSFPKIRFIEYYSYTWVYLKKGNKRHTWPPCRLFIHSYYFCNGIWDRIVMILKRLYIRTYVRIKMILMKLYTWPTQITQIPLIINARKHTDIQDSSYQYKVKNACYFSNTAIALPELTACASELVLANEIIYCHTVWYIDITNMFSDEYKKWQIVQYFVYIGKRCPVAFAKITLILVSCWGQLVATSRHFLSFLLALSTPSTPSV